MYVIKNATLYTMDEAGVVNADICLKDGKITAIGTSLPEEGAKVIDAAGKIITPGLVDAHSHVGGLASETDEDLNEMTNPLTAEMDAYYGINPDARQFKDNLRQGITTSCLVPGSANVVGGVGMIYKSAGSDRVVRRNAVLKAATGLNPKGVYGPKNMAPMTRMAIANMIKTYLKNVQEYRKKKEEAGDDKTKLPPFDLAMEHGIPVLEKKIPLKVHTYMHDMMTVVEIAREFDIYVTIDHAQGASDYYEELTDPHVKGVIYGPISSGLFPGEGGKIDFECCQGLMERGVPAALMTDGPVTPVNLLIYQAGECVRRGMDPVDALALITSSPAKILDIQDRVGTLAAGKDADLLIWDKLPTKYVDARLEQVFIDGEPAAIDIN